MNAHESHQKRTLPHDSAFKQHSSSYPPFRVTFFDGDGYRIETRTYNSLHQARLQAAKVCGEQAHYHAYAIQDRIQEYQRGTVGYDVAAAAQDLRTYCTSQRVKFGGWEFHSDGFRRLLSYIEPTADHMAHDAGYFELTDRGRKLGRYLRRRKSLLAALQQEVAA